MVFKLKRQMKQSGLSGLVLDRGSGLLREGNGLFREFSCHGIVIDEAGNVRYRKPIRSREQLIERMKKSNYRKDGNNGDESKAVQTARQAPACQQEHDNSDAPPW